MEKIVLGLGSNVGDSLGYLRNAVEAISKVAKNCRVSTVYKTKPQDYLKQDDFLGGFAFLPEDLCCREEAEAKGSCCHSIF